MACIVVEFKLIERTSFYLMLTCKVKVARNSFQHLYFDGLL